MTGTQLVVIAKEPVPGRVKTRLCPPCTPESAAAVAAAALADTLRVAGAVAFEEHTLARTGRLRVPDGWRHVAQHGDGLGQRLAYAFADTRIPNVATLLIGMDTPQVTAGDLTDVADRLASADAVIGLAEDGGWWCLALREPRFGKVLWDVPMSTSETGERTVGQLRDRGLRVGFGAILRDVDIAADAWTVAARCHPDSAFAGAVGRHVPQPVTR